MTLPTIVPMSGRPARSALWSVLRRDPISIAGIALLSGIVLIYLFPALAVGKLVTLSDGPLLAILCAWTAVAVLSGIRKLPSAEERRFWLFIGVGFASLLTAMALSLSPLWEGERPLLRLIYDFFVVGFNIALILATTEVPHRPQSWNRAPADRWIVYAGAATLGVGMTAYFDWIPYVVDTVSFQGRVPAFYLFLSLDAILIYRAATLFRQAPSHRWRFYYGLLLLTALLLTTGDLLDALNLLGFDVYQSGTAMDFLWYLSYPPLALGARTRFLTLRDAEEPDRSGNSFGSPLLSFALLVPLVHFSLSITGQLSPAVDMRQRIAALITLVTLLLLLRWQEARAEAWHRELELELEEVRQRLSSAEKLEAVGRLAGGVAHDFNNKLAVILGYAEALESETGHNPRLTEAVTAIRTAAENAAGVTAQLLAIGRRQYVRLQVVEFNEVLAGLAAGIQRTLGESVRLELVRSLRPTFGTVDTVWLERALGHLATNAREAMPQGGSFRMEVRTLDVSEAGVSRRPTLRSGRFVQIEIADNGPGVSSEAIPHLFEPFFSTKSTHEGRGLGLASVRGFVSQCGGFVTIDTAPGNGFACHLHFPRADGPLDKTSPPRTLDQK